MRTLVIGLLLVTAGCTGASASPSQSPASTRATFTRSGVAGTWTVGIASPGGGAGVSFVLHLHGPDEALVGATSAGGQVAGDFADGTLRLDVVQLLGGGAGSYSASTLLDCVVSTDGRTATGTAAGSASGNVTMTRS